MIGAVIGQYQIVRKLGEGGMGAVYLGQHSLLGRRAAIKVLLPALSARPDIVNRFFNEARAVTSISDPGIVQVFDFGYHVDGSAFIVMEFLEGEPLDQRLHRFGHLPVIEALRLTRQIATSLAAAHAQNIIHRDLKPENIFLVRDQEVASGERSKILDFGIAKLSDDHPGKVKTHTGALMGTPVYMSPEQCRGVADLDHRSDIYALGCVLFHLIIGRPPFEGEGMGDLIAAHMREPAPPPSSRMGGIAPNVDALVLRCLAKSPADRFQTMTELAQAIGQVLPYVTSPGAATHYVSGYQAGGTPPPPVPYGTPPPPTPTPYGLASQHPSTPAAPPSPTTLGTSAGQITAARGGSKIGWVVAAVLLVGGAGAAIAVVAMRGGEPKAASGPSDAAVAARPDAVPMTAPRDAPPPPPDATVLPIDAAALLPADAPVVIDAKPSHHHAPPPPQQHPPVPHSGSTVTPPGCDRSVDTDCDGIPDVR